MPMLLLLAVLLEVISIILYARVKRLLNDGRKGDQSQEEFNRQVKKISKIAATMQFVSSLCLLCELLHIPERI